MSAPAALSELLPLAAFHLQTEAMKGAADTRHWKRLGELVVARRVQLGYRRRYEFSAASGISVRILGDIEKGRRSGHFSPTTIAALEQALEWKTESVAAILAGGQPTKVRRAPTHARRQPGEALLPGEVQPDEALIRVMESDDLTEDDKRRLVRMLLAKREADARARVEEAEEMMRILRNRDRH